MAAENIDPIETANEDEKTRGVLLAIEHPGTLSDFEGWDSIITCLEVMARGIAPGGNHVGPLVIDDLDMALIFGMDALHSTHDPEVATVRAHEFAAYVNARERIGLGELGALSEHMNAKDMPQGRVTIEGDVGLCDMLARAALGSRAKVVENIRLEEAAPA